MALLVEDPWPHNGLGRALFNHLLVLGESRGTRTVEAGVLKFTFHEAARSVRSRSVRGPPGRDGPPPDRPIRPGPFHHRRPTPL